MATVVSLEIKLDKAYVEKIKPSRLHGMSFGTRALTPGTAGHAFAAGSRHHEPLGISKAFDHASFHFLHTKAGKGVLPEVVIRAHKTKAQGIADHSFTITLTNAVVASYRRTIVVASSGSGQPGSTGIELEEIRFTYQKIEYTWIKGGVSANDNWNDPTS